MQKPPCEPLFSTLLYEASLYTTSLHWRKFSMQGKVKVTDLILAFFSTLFALNSRKLKDMSGRVWSDTHNKWPISALKVFNFSLFRSRCFVLIYGDFIFFISSINLVWLRLTWYLLFWIISRPRYLNILTFSVPTESTFRRGWITICLKFLVPPQQKSSTCVINKYNSISFPYKDWFCIHGVTCPSVGHHNCKNKSKTLFSAGRWIFKYFWRIFLKA